MARLSDLYAVPLGGNNPLGGRFSRQITIPPNSPTVTPLLFEVVNLPDSFLITGIESSGSNSASIRLYPSEEQLLGDSNRPRYFPSNTGGIIPLLDIDTPQNDSFVLSPPLLGTSTDKKAYIRLWNDSSISYIITLNFIATGLVSQGWSDFLNVINYVGQGFAL